MLQIVLERFENAGGPVDLNQLARELHIDRSALEGMVQFWVRKGRIVDEVTRYNGADVMCSGGACHGCGVSGSCDIEPLTPAGQNFSAGDIIIPLSKR